MLWLIGPASARNTLIGMETEGFQQVASPIDLGLLTPSSGLWPITMRKQEINHVHGNFPSIIGF